MIMGKAQSIFPFYEKRGGEYLLSASFSDVAKCFIVCAQFSSIILNCCLVLQQDIMRAALNDGSGGNKGDFCFLLQFRNGDRSYIAHGRAHFAKRRLHIAPQASSIRNIGIHALFEGKARAFACVITLPIARAVGTFSPVFFHICSVNADFICRALIKTGEIAAKHQEICTHGQGQSHVIIMNNSAI